MPYSPKFNNLGTSERIRVPTMCLDHIDTLLLQYDRLSETKGKEFVTKLMKSIEERVANY